MEPKPPIKREIVVALITHGAVATVLFWYFTGYCPPAINSLKNGGHFPTPFAVFMTIYNFVKPSFPFVIPIVAGMLWLDARILSFLHRQYGAVLSKIWMWSITVIGAFTIAWSIWALNTAW